MSGMVTRCIGVRLMWAEIGPVRYAAGAGFPKVICDAENAGVVWG